MTVRAQTSKSLSRAPASTGAARRITAASVENLAPFRDPVLLAVGGVTLLSLEGAATRLGADWQGRRVEIYGWAATLMSRRLKGESRFLRISETDFLIAQPGVEPAVADETALFLLRDIVAQFLGEPAPEDLRLLRLTGLSADEAVGDPIDADSLPGRTVTTEPDEENLLSSDAWAPFTTVNARRVRPSCVLEPVFELAGHNRIGYRLRRQVIDLETRTPLAPAQQQALARADILRIDRAAIARGASRLRSMSDGGQELSLILPMSYDSLTHPEGGKLVRAISQARRMVSAGVICEVWDIEGVRDAALANAVALIKPAALLVLGHLADERPRVTPAIRNAGVQAIALTCPEFIDGDAQFIGWLKTGLRAASRIGRSAIVCGCRSPRELALAGLLGATHASMRGS